MKPSRLFPFCLVGAYGWALTGRFRWKGCRGGRRSRRSRTAGRSAASARASQLSDHSSYTKVCFVLYDSGAIPRRAIFSPRQTSPTLSLSCPDNTSVPEYFSRSSPDIRVLGISSSGSRFWVAGFEVWSSGLRVQGSGLRVEGIEFRGFRVRVSGLRVIVEAGG